MSDISIDGYGVDVQIKDISAEEAARLMADGLTEVEASEMTFDTGVVNGLLIGQCALFVDNYLVDSLEVVPTEEDVMLLKSERLALVRIEQFNSMYIRFESEEDFDQSKLSLLAERYSFPDGSVADVIYGCEYDGAEYFTESDAGNGPTFFIIGPNQPPVEVACQGGGCSAPAPKVAEWKFG